MNFEGQISGYGSVFVKFKVSSIALKQLEL